jgi:murein DD-endopeptidase MepM/ murein hydrolase activator NlpD
MTVQHNPDFKGTIMSAAWMNPSRWSWVGAIALGSTLGVTALPAHALEVQIQPSDPQLGDTISVIVHTESPDAVAPTVTMNQQTYQTFELEEGEFRALLPTTPLDTPGRVDIQVNGEDTVRNLAFWLSDRTFETQSIWLSDDQAGIEGTDYEFNRVDEFKALVTPERFWDGPFLRPTDGDVSTVYGVRRYYNGDFAEDYYHRGVDYAASAGTPVIAPAAGRIALVGREADGFELHGNTVGIDHGQGVESIFLHLSRIDVEEGDFVEAGDVIGAVGSTGIATGPHLHWGLYVHGMAVDPVPWRYDGIE